MVYNKAVVDETVAKLRAEFDKPEHAERMYRWGHTKPNYPVPALWDTYPDEEYLIMLYQLDKQIQELAKLVLELRYLKKSTVH